MSEIFKGYNSEESSGNALEIDWPSGPLLKDTLDGLVIGSHSRPLRELVARQLEIEGRSLWEGIKPNGYDNIPGMRSREDIVIHEGYLKVARRIMQGSRYFHDRDGLVNMEINLLRLAFDGFESKKEEDGLRRSFDHMKKQAVLSLMIDPTGKDLAMEEQKKNAFYEIEEDVISSFQIGTRRYISLYDESLRGGAMGDKNLVGVFERLVLKTKRTAGKIF